MSNARSKIYKAFCGMQRNLNLNLLPRLIIWEPTFRCNYRCSFCGFYGPGGALPDLKKEMSFEEIKKMWEGIQDAYQIFPHIGITGGEPLIMKDFIPIVRLLNELGFPYSITTNGFLMTEEIAEALKETECEEVRISLHGLKEIHNKTVNIPGAFEKVTNNIKMLRSKGMDVMINCVITNENINFLEDMYLLAKDLNVKIRFQHLEFLNPDLSETHKKFTMNNLGGCYPVKYGTYPLRLENVEKIKTFMFNHPEQVFEPELLCAEDVDNYYSKLLEWRRKPACLEPFGMVRIDAYGNMYPCIDYFFGNLKEQSFKKIWRGEKAKRFKQLLKKCKIFPGCMRCCKL